MIYKYHSNNIIDKNELEIFMNNLNSNTFIQDSLKKRKKTFIIYCTILSAIYYILLIIIVKDLWRVSYIKNYFKIFILMLVGYFSMSKIFYTRLKTFINNKQEQNLEESNGNFYIIHKDKKILLNGNPKIEVNINKFSKSTLIFIIPKKNSNKLTSKLIIYPFLIPNDLFDSKEKLDEFLEIIKN